MAGVHELLHPVANPLRIIAMPVDEGGCGNLRVRQPLLMIKNHTEHDTHVVDGHRDDMLMVAQAVSQADIVILRQGTPLKLTREKIRQALLAMGQELGRAFPMEAKWVLDIDDNMELISPYSEHYSEYGTEEFTHEGVKVWEDQKTFDLTHNRQRLAQHLQDMRDADMVTVTTPVLADYAKQYNPKVTILPNLIDTSAWWPLPLKAKKKLRIGWSGGVSHYEDFYTIKEPLNRILRDFDVELYCVGAHFPGIIDEDFRHKVTVLPWVSFQAHSYRMMCLDLDIAIVPLADLPFNRYKSPVKFLEFAAMGVPSVVASLTPYAEEVTHGVTGLTYWDAEDFYEQLEALITNRELREKLGKNARSFVERERDAAKNAHRWPDAYQTLLT